MDKHMTAFALIEDGVICVCHSEKPCECALGCKRYVLVDLCRLASLESLAAKVPDLEREVETLKAVCGKKDEVIRTLIEEYCGLCDAELHGCAAGRKHPTCDKASTRYEAEQALSLTPTSVAEEAADARVGRAVVEWYRSQGRISIVLNPALEQLGEVIARAREGERNA